MKNLKILFTVFIYTIIPFTLIGQKLHPGFDKDEYHELMLISVRTTGDTNYIKKFDKPAKYKMLYQSKPMGLDNSWDLWLSNENIAVVSLRGTTEKAESWLANFYAAMVPAEGELKLSENEVFTYKLAEDPRASVHVGWLLSLAYLSKEILPRIDSCSKAGIKDFLLMGHSQGGAINYLLASYLSQLQKAGKISSDLRFKTYISAGPKPGNLYFAYDFETTFKEDWAFNVVNTADWVPEVPISIQTLNDFNTVNPFVNADQVIKSQRFPKNIAARIVFNKLDKPTRKAQRNYEKYLGNMTSKMIRKQLPDFVPPHYVSSSHYVRTGKTIVLPADQAYYEAYPDQPDKIFCHHVHDAYLFLLKKY